MTAKSTADRQKALRERRAAQGFIEVRGIWAKPEHHQQIKQYAKLLEVSDIKAVDTIKTC